MTAREAKGAPVTLETDRQGVARLALGAGSVGVARIEGSILTSLDASLREVERLAAAGRAAVLVVRAPAASALDRAELLSLIATTDPAEATREAAAAQAVLRRLELLPIPSIAAIDGSCLGVALELALACSYRAAAEPSSRFGFPQIRLGVIPGLGGTVRLPRLIGTEAALRLVVRGERWDGATARETGLVDLLLPAADFPTGLAAFARERTRRGRVRSGPRRAVGRRLLEDTAPGRRILFARVARGLERDHLLGGDAARAALESVADGISLPLERAFAHEAELYGQLLAGEPAKALLHAALLEGQATHAHPPALTRVEQAGVIGVGPKATELAWRLARRGLAVRIRDRDRSALAVGVQALRDRLAAAAGDRPAPERRVEGTAGFGGFGTLDLLASVEERPRVVAAELAAAEEHVSEACLLISTSPLVRVGEVAASLRGPGRTLAFVGPGLDERFPAIEIAGSDSTRPEALAAACQLARRLGGVPIHVADRPGFLVTRLLAVYLAQGARLVDEGAAVGQVDAPMEGLGFALGPLRLVDALGPQRALRLVLGLGETLGEIARPAAVLGWLAERGARFYRYHRGRPLGPNPELRSLAHADDAPTAEEIRDRLLLVLVNEAARALDEGVVASAADLDLAAIHGLGLPRRAGGLLYQADRMGLRVLEARLREVAGRLGDAYRPAPLLARLAAAGGTFHPPRETLSGHAERRVLG